MCKQKSSLSSFKNKVTHKLFSYKLYRECPRGVMVKAIDCRILVNEFKPQSRYYVHFRTNTLRNE